MDEVIGRWRGEAHDARRARGRDAGDALPRARPRHAARARGARAPARAARAPPAPRGEAAGGVGAGPPPPNRAASQTYRPRARVRRGSILRPGGSAACQPRLSAGPSAGPARRACSAPPPGLFGARLARPSAGPSAGPVCRTCQRAVGARRRACQPGVRGARPRHREVCVASPGRAVRSSGHGAGAVERVLAASARRSCDATQSSAAPEVPSARVGPPAVAASRVGRTRSGPACGLPRRRSG